MVERGVPTGGSLTDVFGSFIAQGWHRNDVRGKKAWPLVAAGRTVLIEHDLSSEEERRTDPYYQEFFGPIGLPWFACVAFSVQGAPWSLTLLRGTGQGPYDRSHIPRLQELRPHMSRAIRLATNLGVTRDLAATDMLELVRDHGMALDRSGNIIWLSTTAAAFVGPELTVKSRKLIALDGALNRLLQAKIAAALVDPTPSSHMPGSSMLVRRENSDHFLVEIVRLPLSSRDIFSKASALVFFRPIRVNRPVDIDVLVGLFGLTPGEAKVASLVATGITAVEAATRLGIGYETVRKHLGRAYAKMGVSGQSELARIVAALQ